MSRPLTSAACLRLLATLSVFSVPVQPALAFAQTKPVSYGRANAEYQKLFTLADADQDGRLSRAEAREHMPRLMKDFPALDINGDGYVSRGEYSVYVRNRYHPHSGRDGK